MNIGNLAEGKCLRDKLKTILEHMEARNGAPGASDFVKTTMPDVSDRVLLGYLLKVMSPLEKWRRENGLTQAEVAKRFGCTMITIKNWEQGRHSPRKTDKQRFDDATDPGLWVTHTRWFQCRHLESGKKRKLSFNNGRIKWA